MRHSISVIILTYNEERHIARCIENVKAISEEIYVIDSYSSDKTCDIATSLGAIVIQHPFINQAQQLQWALDTCKFKGDWTLRLDADEYLSNELITEIQTILPTIPQNITGIDIPRDVIFMGKNLKWGKTQPTRLLRLWRTGAAYTEQRWMDEHCILKYGDTYHMKHLFFDDNRNGLTEWINKHNKYTNREIIVSLNERYGLCENDDSMQVRNKRKSLYYALPLFFRAQLYFVIRYVFLLGFLDGLQGLIWHTLQAFWYRFLIDSKIKEMQYELGENPSREEIINYISTNYHIHIE